MQVGLRLEICLPPRHLCAISSIVVNNTLSTCLPETEGRCCDSMQGRRELARCLLLVYQGSCWTISIGCIANRTWTSTVSDEFFDATGRVLYDNTLTSAQPRRPKQMYIYFANMIANIRSSESYQWRKPYIGVCVAQPVSLQLRITGNHKTETM